MKICTKLRLNAITALTAAVLILVAFAWSYRGMMRGDRAMHLAEDLRKIALKRALLLDGYLLNGDDRAVLRWGEESARFRARMDIARAGLTGGDERRQLDELVRVFEDTVGLKGTGQNEDPFGSKEQVFRLKQRDRDLVVGIDRLEETIATAADKARDRSVMFLILFIAMGFIVTVGNAVFINRMLARRLGVLREGAEIIGSGNLGYRLEVSGDDELAELARLTNRMAANLQGSFTSLENLEKEIEARKRVEKEREQYFKFFQSSVDLMCIADLNGCFKTVNPAGVRLLGYDEGELLSRTFIEFVHPDDRQATREEIARQIGTGSSVDFENRYLCKNGEVRWISWRANYSPEDDISYAAGRDVTEHKRAEQELLKLSIAVEQSPVSIVITDTKGNIEFVNPKFTQITGYESGEVIGRNPSVLKSDETPPETYRRLWSAISSGRVWQGTFHNRKKNGESFLEFATIAPVKNRQGSITNYIAIKEDMTERRNLESQLRQSQKMEAIGILAGGVAHDFNNILTAIIGFCGLLELRMTRDDPQYHHVAQIVAAADRAANLTRSLLAFSRKQRMETRVLDLNGILAGVEKMLRRLVREDIDVTIRTLDAALTVLVDAGQIEQVLINLVTNARDAMPGGGLLTITTSVATLDEAFTAIHGYGSPGEYALLRVADTGLGMEEHVRQRIFDPFFTTKEVGKGTGLGLSVCYGIVKQHDGYIGCSSEPAGGTKFDIYLPIVRGEPDMADTDGDVDWVGGRGTILLAEDDETVRGLVVSILTEFGYTVIEAADGEDAVARFRERGGDVDLCLFDVIMPKKKGWEAFEEILGIRGDARGLFMSGYQTDFDRVNDLTKNGAGFIPKPINPRGLLLKVRELIDG